MCASDKENDNILAIRFGNLPGSTIFSNIIVRPNVMALIVGF